MLFLPVLLMSHVPSYSGCVDNCCKPLHSVDISQVFYLKGSGGLEVHTDDINQTILDIDVVFRDIVDKSMFSLYVGCGGCMPQDPIVIPPLSNLSFGPKTLEPFTQTSYYSILEHKTFNTSVLKSCTEGHFTIRLVTDQEHLVWAPVIGLRESFTMTELFLFPVFILRNHGSSWNDLGWTIWVWCTLGIVQIFVFARSSWTLRAWCYFIASVAFTTAFAEEVTHTIVAQRGITSLGTEFWVAILVVALLAQGFGFAFVVTMWYAENIPGSRWRSFLEVFIGTILLFFLGSGFYVASVAIFVAAASRFLKSGRLLIPC